MRLLLLIIPLSAMLTSLNGQDYQYHITNEQPYGKLNPEAPEQLADYKELIGKNSCKSVSRIDQNTWADTVEMVWVFKYIMNGLGVQDETLKSDGLHSGSIRQYSVDSSKWYVHYYSNGGITPTLSAWEGNRDGNSIILYRDQAAPNGTPGYFKIRFYDIKKDSFNWAGAWVNKGETFVYPTWNIYCTKVE